MTSRESEPRQSMGPPQLVKGTQETRRDPNPQTDYKGHFNRTKQRFDIVTADQAVRKKELDRASAKQIKLQEELEFLLDTIAGEQMRAKHLQREFEQSPFPQVINSYIPDHIQPSRDIFDTVDYIEENANNTKRQRPSPTDTEDELLAAAGIPTKRFREDER